MTGRAAGRHQPLNRRAQGLHQLKPLAQRENHPFHYRARHMGLGVAQTQTDEACPQVRLHVGRALPGQKGQEEQPIQPGLHRLGHVRQRGVALTGEDLVAQPAQRQPGREDGGFLVPGIRQAVTEEVQAQVRVMARLAQWGKELPARADSAGDCARLHHALGQRLGRNVTGPQRHRRAGQQPAGGSHLGQQAARRRARRLDLRQSIHGQIKLVQQLRGPAPHVRVEQQGGGSIGRLAGRRPGEAEAGVIFWQQQQARAARRFRLVLGKPGPGGQHETGRQRVAGPGGQPLAADAPGQRAHLLRGALVSPQDGGPQRLATCVQADQRVHLPGQPQPGHLARMDARLADCLFAAGQRGRQPIRRVLLCPTRARCVDGVFAPGPGQQPPGAVNHHRFRAGSADVEADEVRRGHGGGEGIVN